MPEVLNVHVNESKKNVFFFRNFFFPNSEKLTFEKENRIFQIFFQISIYFIELWLIFCKFRLYKRSELQVHKEKNIFRLMHIALFLSDLLNPNFVEKTSYFILFFLEGYFFDDQSKFLDIRFYWNKKFEHRFIYERKLK